MSTTPPPPEAAEAAVETPRTAVDLRYDAMSRVEAAGNDESVTLVGNAARDPVRLRGRLRDPVRAREALSALYSIVASDFRYVPKDRTALLAFRQTRQKASGAGAWEARRQYFSWLMRNDPLAFVVLDPIVSVFPDQISFEVFSKDEASYARLALSLDALELDGELKTGTTNIDFSEALYGGLQQLRSYRHTWLDIGGAAAVAVETTGAPSVLEKHIQLPDTWLRGFLQVQSAATLPTTRFSLAPIDLYNVLRHLRLHADIKRKGRGLRVELVPGEPPRLVLEPWEEVFTTSGAPYAGRLAQVIKVWGRRRLSMLRRLLPFVDSVDVHLLGSGLPSFWVLRAGSVTLTLGMSGFTAANWAQAVSFDLLLPRARAASPEAAKVLSLLALQRSATVAALAEAAGVKPGVALEALQRGCQQGLVIYDLAQGVYRHRPLLGVPLDAARFEFRNQHERQAYDLLAAGAVRIDTENRIPGAGLELVGRVLVEADRREYRPQILLDDEDGRVKKAECTCAFFRKHALKEGPCAHLVALCASHAAEEAKRRAGRSTEGRRGVQVETRTYIKRDARGEAVTQLSLNHKRVFVQWGPRGGAQRAQTLLFDTPDQARDAYFSKVDSLEARGFLDTSAG